MTNDTTVSEESSIGEVEASEFEQNLGGLWMLRLHPIYIASSQRETCTLEQKMKLFETYVKCTPWRQGIQPPDGTPLEVYAASGVDKSVLVSPQLRELSRVYIYTGHLQAPTIPVEVLYSREGFVVKLKETTFYLSPFRFHQRDDEKEDEKGTPVDYTRFGLNPATYAPVKVVPITIGSPEHHREAEQAWKEIEPHVQLGRRRNPKGGIDTVMSGILDRDNTMLSLHPREHPIYFVHITSDYKNKGTKKRRYAPLRIGIDYRSIEIVNLEDRHRYTIYFEPRYFGERVHWQSL